MTAFLVINLSLAVLWFFKGSAWSVRQKPQPGTPREPAAFLRERLLGVNQQKIPVQVVASPGSDSTLEITWRYADAQWLDLMRAHKMQRTHKLVLALKEQSYKARVRGSWSAFDASAGPNDVRLSWTAATGMQFFQFEHGRVVGVQLDASGKATSEFCKALSVQLARVETANH